MADLKTIGIIGGMSWQSSALYYKLINEEVAARLGGFHSAKILLASVDFAEIEECQRQGQWDKAAKILSTHAKALEQAGAGLLVLSTNTMHKVAGQMMAGIVVPLLHIAVPTGQELKKGGFKKPLLLATRFTMKESFYRDKLVSEFGLSPMIPDESGVNTVHTIIYDELCKGDIKEGSRRSYIDIINKAKANGADSVILGCTEIGLLISAEDSPLPVFDTTRLHAHAAVDWALGR